LPGSISRLTRRHLAAIAPYEPGKPPEELERELGIPAAIKLASNENPVGASPRALAAARDALASSHRYADSNVHTLRTELAARLQVAPAELSFGHGSNELIDLFSRVFAGREDHAVIGVPSFACYRLSLLAAQVPFTEVPLDEGLYWNVDRLLQAVQPSTRLLFLDNPNNPTSTHVPGSALERLLRGLGPDVIPVVDEAYVHYCDAPDYQSALGLRALHPNLIVLRTFSKAYGLASLRVGFAVGPAELLADLERVRLPFNVNGVAQAAALAALGDHEHLQRVVAVNREQRARLSAELPRLGLRVAPSQANFLCVELPPAMKAADAYQALLRKGVIVRPFGAMSRHLRISVGLAEENERLLAALRELLG
jgi:histidinol-phosphate aminotransferase